MVFKVASILLLSLTSSISFKTNEKKFLNEDVNGKVIYVDISLNQSLIGNDPYIHYVNGESDQNINLILDDSYIYHTESNLSFSGEGYYEICCSSEYVTEHLDNNVLLKNNYNYVCVSENTSIKGYGYYGDRLANPGATYKTQRVWLDNSNHYFTMDDDWGSKRTTAIGYYYNNNWNVIEMETIINSYNNATYHYADIPFNVNSVNFMAMSNSESHSYLVYEDHFIEYLSYGVCYNINDGGETNVSTIQVEGANGPLLSLVVEAYLTYGKNDSNGCTESTVKNLFITWFEHKSASASELKSYKIPDYTGYSSNNNSYDGLKKESYFSINEKWSTMCSQAGIDPKTGVKRSFINLSWLNGNTGKFVTIVGGVAIVTIISLVVLIIIRKKKEQE